MFLVLFQFLLAIILLSNNFYKKHSLYDLPRINYIQKTDFKPIKSFSNGYYYSYDTLTNTEFSIIKTEKYSKKCIENYYIENDNPCPVTDITFIEEQNDNCIVYNKVQVGYDEHFYYTNDNKSGKLYKSFDYYDFKKNIEDSFDVSKIARKEKNKISNPVIDLKNYIKYCDVILLLSVFASIYYTFMESYYTLKYDQFKILNVLIQIEIMIFYIIRFTKFIKEKKFFFDNKDIYDNDEESYFPNSCFNIDSFPLALSINIFIYEILHYFFPKKEQKSFPPFFHNICDICCCFCCCCHFDERKNYADDDENRYTFLLILPLFISFFVFEILDFVNGKTIIKIADNILYNWNFSPIKAIDRFNWKYEYFETEKLNLNYSDIYSKTKGKICGKDNLGNNLYFNYNEECPINKIFISDLDEDLPDYHKKSLGNNNYLYYTNKYIRGKIIIDFKVTSDLNINISPDNAKDLWISSPFTEEIDSNTINGKSYLLAVNYIGIDENAIPREDSDKIYDLKDKIEYYNFITPAKIGILCCETLCLIIFILILICPDCCCCQGDCYIILFNFFNLGFVITYIVLLSINIHTHEKYINGFLFKINLDFKRVNNYCNWNIISLIYHFIMLIIILININFKRCLKNYIFQTNEERQETYTVSVFQRDTNKEKIERLTEDLRKEKYLNRQLREKNEGYLKLINDKEKEINTLKINLSKMDELIINNKENKADKVNTNVNDIITINFESGEIRYEIKCSPTDIFSDVEEKLYKIDNNLKNANNIFSVNEKEVFKFKTLSENNIKDGDKIMISKFEPK